MLFDFNNKKKIDGLQKNLDAAQAQIEKLTVDYQNSENFIGSLQADIIAKDIYIKELQAKQNELEANIEQLQNSLNTAQETIAKFDAEKEAVQVAVQTIIEKQEEKLEEMADAKAVELLANIGHDSITADSTIEETTPEQLFKDYAKNRDRILGMIK